MRIHTTLLTLTLLFLFPLSLFAQREYYGTVVENKNGKGMETAVVTLLAADSAIIHYTYTDEHGAFRVESSHSDIRYLSVSFMGFARQFIPAESYRNGSIIRMEEQAMKIREVKITSQRIRQRNDTLTYTVSGFKMPQDRVIADVLKKIPGIEVLESGTIKYQNRAISQFYIEGMNLLEGKYSIATKNIPANMVKEVQVLKGHQAIAALRGKSFSSSTALNLILQEGAKSRLVKLIDVGIGVGHRPDVIWDNRLMGMIFGRNMQNITMYKNNNTGKNIADELMTLTATRAGVYTIGSESEPNLFTGGINQPASVERERSRFDDAHLVATNHLYKPNKATDLRAQFSFLHNEKRGDSYTETDYFYPSGSFSTTEERHVAEQENRVEGDLTYQLNDSNLFLKSRTKGVMGMNKSNLSLITDNSPMRSRTHPEQKQLENFFELVKNFGGQTFSLYSNNSYTELPQYLTVTPGIYADSLNDGKPYDLLRQEAMLRTFHSHTYTYFQHKLAGWYVKYTAGVEYDNRKLSSTLLTDEVPTYDSLYANDLRVEKLRVYVEPSLRYKSTFWSFQLSVPLNYQHTGLTQRLPATERQQLNRFLPGYRLNISHDFDARWTASASSSWSFDTPDIRQLYAGYLFSAYNSASAYAPLPAYNKRLSNTLRAQFTNPLTGFFIVVSGFYNLNKQETIDGYRNQSGFLTLSQTKKLPNSGYTAGAYTRLSKTFAWSKLYFALSANYTHRENQILLEESLIHSTGDNLSLQLDYSLQPFRFLNFEGSSRGAYSTSQLHYNEGSLREAWSFRHHLDINILFSTAWKAKLSHTLTHDNINRRAIYFMDASLRYTHRLFDLEASVRNLFDYSRFDEIHISDISTLRGSYLLRGREALVKASFSF
jgi:hypothetical protein